MTPQEAQALWEREQAKEAARIQAEEAIRQMAYQRQAESSGFTGPTQAPPEGWQPPTEAIEPSWSPIEEIATLGAGGLAREPVEALVRAAGRGASTAGRNIAKQSMGQTRRSLPRLGSPLARARTDATLGKIRPGADDWLNIDGQATRLRELEAARRGAARRGASESAGGVAATPLPRPAPGTRIKSPGPGVRKLTDAEKELMRENAEMYARDAARRWIGSATN